MSVSSPAPDPIWEKMVGGDLSQAEILFKRHREELFRFTCGQLGARRRSAQSDADDIVQECFTRMLQLAQRLCLLHQHINTPALLAQLLAECTSPGSSHTPEKLSDLARWIKRILGDQFPKLLAARRPEDFQSALLHEYTRRTQQFPIRTWLFAAAKTQMIDGIRAGSRTEHWTDDFDPPASSLPEQTTAPGSHRDGLAHCLPKLSAEDRSLLQIRFSGLDSTCLLQELNSAAMDDPHESADVNPAEALRRKTRLKNKTYAEVAASTGLTAGALGKRMRKLYDQLRSCIERHLGGVA